MGDDAAYNRFLNLDAVVYRIIDHLARSQTKYADYLWKILAYDTEDCLSKPSLSYKERIGLVYLNNGDASIKRVFMSPYIDDGWVEQSSHLHIYIHSIKPQNNVLSTVNVCFELITHNKISNIVSDANELNKFVNPAEMSDDGSPIVRYKSRTEVMLRSVLAELNGIGVAGVGTFSFNATKNDQNWAKMSLWNNKKFFGYELIMSTMMSGVSDDTDCGY